MPNAHLAFKYVAIAVMMAALNDCADKLQLKEHLPITYQDTIRRNAFVLGNIGFAGRIDTPRYSFGFAHGGKARVITKLEDKRYQSQGLYRGDQSMKEFMKRFSRVKSAINTNDAYRLATNWLTAIGIDVARLQREQPVKVEQQFSLSETGEELPCPLFYVSWCKGGLDKTGHPNSPVVNVMLSGINGELLSLLIDGDSYSKRPLGLIKNEDKLLAIPDAEFLKYSLEERSNLVVRFSAVNYSRTNAETATNVPSMKLK